MVETVFGMTDLHVKLLAAVGQLGMAAGVGYVAYRQWRTAEQQAITAKKKLKADLFDRRLAALEGLEATIASFRTKWPAPDLSAALVHHREKFGYLFSRQVAAAVAELNAIARMASQSQEILQTPESEGLGMGQRRAEAWNDVTHQRMKFFIQVNRVRQLAAYDMKLSH